MKKLLLFTFCIWGLNSLLANNPEKGLYFWNTKVLMTPAQSNGTATGGIAVPSLPNQQFYLIEIINDQGLIMVVDYKQQKSAPTQFYFTYNFSGKAKDYDDLTSVGMEKSKGKGEFQAYFLVDIADIDKYASKKIGSSFSVGTINYPIKFRPQSEEDFTGSFNIGASLGIKLPHRSNIKFHHSLVVGLGITNVVLDANSINADMETKEGLLSKNNYSAMIASCGWIIENGKAQLGVFFGFDGLNRNNQETFDWDYQWKPWVSIGFGYALFSSEEKEKKNNGEQKNPDDKPFLGIF